MLRLKTFGGLSLERDGTPVEGAGAQRRRLALLALLAVSGDRGITRDKVLALLWPESDPERSRKALAQAVYALRHEFGAEELVVGTTDLRLGWEGFTSDVEEFRRALARRDWADAAARYDGAFLDGVHVDGAPEFDRWADAERTALAHDYVAALERLADAADQAGETRAAVGWWRKLANADPLNARVALGLMRALAAQGDRGAALQHYRVYEMLLRQELELAPDGEIQQFAERLRTQKGAPDTVGPPASRHEPPPDQAGETVALPRARVVPRPGAIEIRTPPHGVPPRPGFPASPRPARGIPTETDEYARPRPIGEAAAVAPLSVTPPPAVRRPFLARRSTQLGIAIGLALGLAVAGLVAVRRGAGSSAGTPVVAVGLIRNYSHGSDDLARPLADMLATNLARAEGLQVISATRMYELVAQQGPPADSSAALMTAARAAGATELVDGSLLDSAGVLRLDLRRTDLASGSLLKVYRVSGRDIFALVDSGTAALVRTLGLRGPASPIADVSTASLAAYRLYEEGLRALFGGDPVVARQLLARALAEDSTFAMAAFWYAQADQADMDYTQNLSRAVRLAARATERERLIIRAGWAEATDNPNRLAVAESLVTRYPNEPDGYLWLGHARTWSGDFVGALEPLRHVIVMDSLALKVDPRLPGAPPRCRACEAYGELISAYHLMDSLPAAERVAREWTGVQPENFSAWSTLAMVLMFRGRYTEALAASQRVTALAPVLSQDGFRAMLAFRAGDFARADSFFRIAAQARGGTREFGLKWLTISARTQGRPADGLAPARALRATEPVHQADAAPYDALFEAQVWYDLGQYRQAAALFDSISRAPRDSTASQVARHRVWSQTLRATALAAAGDTALLPAIEDSIRRWAGASGYGRDRRLYHHIRGLLFVARGQDEAAVTEFSQAIFGPAVGYTRTNLELGRALLRLHRPQEAAAWAEAGLRGPFDGTNTYVTQTELAELAALAWDAAGRPEQALARYRQVAANWADADARYGVRVERARLRIAALSGR